MSFWSLRSAEMQPPPPHIGPHQRRDAADFEAQIRRYTERCQVLCAWDAVFQKFSYKLYPELRFFLFRNGLRFWRIAFFFDNQKILFAAVFEASSNHSFFPNSTMYVLTRSCPWFARSLWRACGPSTPMWTILRTSSKQTTHLSGYVVAGYFPNSHCSFWNIEVFTSRMPSLTCRIPRSPQTHNPPPPTQGCFSKIKRDSVFPCMVLITIGSCQKTQLIILDISNLIYFAEGRKNSTLHNCEKLQNLCVHMSKRISTLKRFLTKYDLKSTFEYFIFVAILISRC